MRHLLLSLCGLLLAGATAWASDGVVVTGSIASDVLLPQDDAAIGTEATDCWALTNTYADVNLMSRWVDAGVRAEFTQYPLPGYESDFAGWGIPHAYVKGKTRWGELTAGSFYEQFGSGFILRTYEERSLGVDNALVGGRLVLTPMEGLTIKALAGKQRQYWSLSDGFVSGADVEWDVLRGVGGRGSTLTLGASWVNKYEGDEDLLVTQSDGIYRMNLPLYVNAFDLRANWRRGAYSVLAEYALKTQDPSADNDYSYAYGNVAMLSASYSRRGMSALLQLKRSDNMSFRSERSTIGTSAMINHLPAFTLDHTYTLAALYPYATHAAGEWAAQAELGYKCKKGTALGGRYGTDLRANLSHVRGLDNTLYYQDANIQVEKKLSRAFKLNAMYMNQIYNKTVVEGEGGTVHANIFVLDGKYRFNAKYTLRGEMQYLQTRDDQGDWLFALAELSVMPRLMFTLSDEWNAGMTGTHYYQGYVTINHASHRLQVGYGRTRAGYNCSGGVCRYVPASKGLTLSYNYNF